MNELGIASCKAQGLKCAITSFIKMQTQPCRIYIARGNEHMNNALGFIKVGYKRLFIVVMN